jgi:predicted ATP-binding protein involved in virulence
MKLVYCWINNHLGIENQGFNFGSEWIYSHDLNGNTLNITRVKNENYIKDYFKIDSNKGFENVTAIVGENGAGKSLIIKSIIKVLAGIPILHEMVLVFETDSTFKVIDKLISTKLISNISKIENKNKSIFHSIFYNPIYDFTDGFSLGYIWDISSSKMLRDDIFKQEIENIDVIHRSKEIIRAINLIIYIEENFETNINDFLPFKLPNYLTFKIYYENGYVDWDLNFELKGFGNQANSKPDQNLKKLEEIYKIAFEIYEKGPKNPFERFLIYYFKKICEKINDRVLTTSGINLNSINKTKTQKDLKTYIGEQIENLQNETIKPTCEKNRYLDIFSRFEEEFKIQKHFQISTESLTLKGVSLANQLVHDYEILMTDFGIREDLISIYWDGISTGEKAFLNLFSRFHTISSSIINIKKPDWLYVFIDEGELGFHVQWQQKYLDFLIKGLPELFQNVEKPPKMQLIFTTHSPIVLSDMPKDHTVFLRKVDNKTTIGTELDTPKTFAANIHDILKHDFFMDKSFMGEHVKNKINEVIEVLKMKLGFYESDKDKAILEKNEALELQYPNDIIEQIIKNIDEPILKIKLSEMFERARGGNSEKGRLEARNQILQNQINENNVAIKKIEDDKD